MEIKDMIDQVIEGDCLEVMKRMPDNSIDLIVTDPPYNIGKDFENEDLPKEEHLKWCEKWIRECIRVLDIGGAFYLTLGWQCVAEIKVIFNKFQDMRLKNWIVWYRQDGWKGDNGFAQSHEHILYLIKDNVPPFNLIKFGKHIKEKRIEAGYKTISEFMDKMGLYKKVKRRNGSEDYWSGNGWFETGKKKPRLQELIRLNQLLDLDDEYKVKSVSQKKELDPKRFNVFFNKVDVCDDVWLTPKSEKRRLGHPTQKPTELFRRIIKASSNEGDIVFDPFGGSGTTAVACKQLNRYSITIEINPEYCKIARKRIQAVPKRLDKFMGDSNAK